jgi:hypothetical protein
MRGSWLRWALLVAVGLLLVAVAVGPPDEGRGEPLDPRGTGPDGARALVLLLQGLGADVDVERGSPVPGAATAVLLRDSLDDADRAAVRAWVEAGGVLVVADDRSPLADGAVDAACPAALADVTVLDAGTLIDPLDGGEGTCFDGFVRVDDAGAGFVVALGAPGPLTNRLLGEADNAQLAVSLLAPAPGTRVAFVDGGTIAAAAEDDLGDLVGAPVAQALALAAVAVAVWVLHRGRRLGRPVVEEQPVDVAGSELVVAVGRLLDGRRRPDEAAAILRAQVSRAAVARLGLPATADPRTIGAAVASRGGLDEARAAAALGERPVVTDDDLLDVAADLDRILDDLLGRTRV